MYPLLINTIIPFFLNSHLLSKTTPFNVVYGREPPTLLKYGAGVSSVAVVDAQLRDRDEFLEEIRQRLLLS
jgi:hypothetical protein